eukprot:g70697.t1
MAGQERQHQNKRNKPHLRRKPVYCVVVNVTNTNDTGAGSLRMAINAASSGDIIQFDATLANQTITLSSALPVDQ